MLVFRIQSSDLTGKNTQAKRRSVTRTAAPVLRAAAPAGQSGLVFRTLPLNIALLICFLF